MELEKATSFEVAFFVQIPYWFILPTLFLVVIAEARAHTRYGTGSVVAVGYPRSPHIAVISTPVGSYICSSDSCDGKALAEFLWFDRLTNHAKTVTAHNLADNNNFISCIQ